MRKHIIIRRLYEDLTHDWTLLNTQETISYLLANSTPIYEFINDELKSMNCFIATIDDLFNGKPIHWDDTTTILLLEGETPEQCFKRYELYEYLKHDDKPTFKNNIVENRFGDNVDYRKSEIISILREKTINDLFNNYESEKGAFSITDLEVEVNKIIEDLIRRLMDDKDPEKRLNKIVDINNKIMNIINKRGLLKRVYTSEDDLSSKIEPNVFIAKKLFEYDIERFIDKKSVEVYLNKNKKPNNPHCVGQTNTLSRIIKNIAFLKKMDLIK